MMADDSHNLLLRFSRHRSDEAIRTLVQRHSPLVFATALRRLNGDHSAAQDVTQEVFTLLARKAATLQGVFVSGWLHRQACRRAANHVRTEQRRRQREKIAGEAMDTTTGTGDSPFLFRELDEALLKLPAPEHDAVILRFFEGKDYRQLGLRLGITEEAARKRVKRSLDRLGGILGKRGQALTGGALEVKLLGMESPPIPEALVRSLSANAAKTGTGSSTAVAFLKPVLTGSLLASLAAGGTLSMQLLRQEPEKTPAASPTTARERRERTDTYTTLPAGSPLEAIISEIKRLKSGPAHTLTRLQLDTLLERISIEQIPDFMALAEERLNPSEQAAAYEPLLKRWAAKDPNAALTHVLQSGIAARRDGAIWGNTLLGNLLTSWLERSRDAPAAWLIANQDHPFLRPGGEGEKLVGDISKGYYLHGNHAAVFHLIDALHFREAKMNAFQSIAGEGSMWVMNGKGKAERWMKFHRALEHYGDPALKEEFSIRFWQNLASMEFPDLQEAMKDMNPRERFQASLGVLSSVAYPKNTYDESGNLKDRSFKKVIDREQREVAAIEAGAAAGYTHQQTLPLAGDALSRVLNDTEFGNWISKHPELDLDDSILRRIRSELAANGGRIDDPKEAISLRWAAMIRDPELRLSTARAAFIRLLAVKPELASKNLALLPEELSADLNPMMPTTP
ncbi:sigma-70 family RNA polymerase sigma factor [Luteolibacter sp. SL250]|uniref:RNA polymerase sigma factor n=1 Tax=Luteolibacter sp. SL250 TaxID=2995170 RepID=UPI00227188B0|nr:sigma-70 family RNA polymerase sigma factor [Luteolibacter sp. SL250]WAC18434.1 sigma-70 family RNA polymerase sigma factor [Luteolibacter sp. SL250]